MVVIAFKSTDCIFLCSPRKLSVIANILPANFSAGHVYAATSYDPVKDQLFAIVSDEFKNDIGVVVFSVHSLALTVSLIDTKQHERFGAEIVMQSVWVSNINSLIVFLQAVSVQIGFDQILTVDPYTGKSSFMFYNLMENLLGFECTPDLKDCDRLSTACYDPLQQRLYFQATQYTQSDDMGTTTLQFIGLEKRFPYINAGLDPFSFGFENYQFVQVVA